MARRGEGDPPRQARGGAAPRTSKRQGFRPDVIFAHIGWGEALFLKDIFPDATRAAVLRVLLPRAGRRRRLRPGIPDERARRLLRLRVMNAPLLMSLDASDWGIAPTRWQQQQFPAALRASA